ncbi:exopolysaccharide biosynthesis-like tyrosine-protein kinase [Caballeronia sordidicola]|uniref:Exopolysaccharide biosynthesis-like tyrosine-protein kinase n=1 Tax=Caballeronia sordidicola TaxID=196367 RepID=A0A158G5A7_CABSO|nr:polysaccharide biosynthesis tyrosine autokinase [Caballeronia sordidicola]SAL27294.1 exopolysaccharide biosynthesis-like tyrosine-protein kinase [Caballeronia sordidicola]
MSTYEMLEHSPAQAKDDEFVLRDLVRMITDQIWWVLGIALGILLAAVLYAKLSTPIYSADALVQVDTPSANSLGSNQGALSAALTPTGGSLHADSEIEIIKSRTVIEPVVDQFNLNFSTASNVMPFIGRITPWFARKGHPLPAVFGLNAYAWGGEEFKVDAITVPAMLQDQRLTLRALGNGRFALLDSENHELLQGLAGSTAKGNGVTLLVSQLVARPGTEFYVTRASQLEAVQAFGTGMQVAEKGKDTGIIQISYSGSQPLYITQVANALAASYLKQRTERAQEEANRMLTFLNNELPRVRDELRASETALAQYQTTAGSFQPTQEAQTYLSGGLDYERQIAALRMQRVQLLQRFTEGADEVRAVDAQLAALNVEKSRFDNQFKTLPGSERQAVSLQREAKVNSEIYVALLNKTQELSISRAGTVGNVHIIDMALVPSQPVKPKAALIIAAGGLLGVIAGVVFAFVRRSFFAGVDDPELVERRFNLPIFGAIPFSAEQARQDRIRLDRPMALPTPSAKGGMKRLGTQPVGDSIGSTLGLSTKTPVAVALQNATVLPAASTGKQPLLSTTHPFDTSIEGLRGLRATLQFALVDAPNRVIAITSPAPSDGKSFLAANLAALLAESGKRVLLIDADLRRGRLAHYLGKSSNGGLTELLSGQTDFEMAARETGVNGLHFIGSGAHPPNPSEILTSSRFASLLQAFEKQFDLVIVDTPPLLAVPDAAVIASLAGSTVLVMRSGAHSEKNIADALKKLKRARARIVGGVLNAMPAKSGGRKGTYDYAYAYTYSSDPAVVDVKH